MLWIGNHAFSIQIDRAFYFLDCVQRSPADIGIDYLEKDFFSFSYNGQIKRALTNAAFVSGIGNAYADEILFEARIYPFEPSKNIPEEKLRELYEAIGRVYAWAVPIVAERTGEKIEIKIRDFLKVHRKGGEPCPTCGAPITEVTPNQRTTSYCRSCQGWGEAKLRGSSLGA